MKKVLIMMMVAMLVVAAFAVTAFAADWTEFGTGEDNNSVVDEETPRTADETELVFKATVKDAASWDANTNVLAVGDYVYVGNGTEILKLDKTGAQVGKATLTATMSSFAPFLAYDNGTIFAYVTAVEAGGYIEAIDAATMTRVWRSEPVAGMLGMSPITVSNGSLYIAVSGYDWGNYVPTAGYVIAMTTTDDNPASQDEVKANTFLYNGGDIYYWNGVAVSGNVIIAGSSSGNIQTINATTGALIDTQAVGASVKSSVAYVNGVAYFGTETGIGSVAVAADGTIDDASRNTKALGDQVTTTPVVNGGRLYCGTGNFMGGAGFFVLEAATLNTIYTAEIEGVDNFTSAVIPVAGVQSSPALTTSYGSDVYVYFSINALPGAIVALKDSAGQTAADITAIYTPETADQNATSAAFTIGDDAVIYYTNDSGNLFAVRKAEPEPEPTPEPTPTPSQVVNPQTGGGGSAWLLIVAAAALAIGAAGFVLSRRLKATR